MAVDCVWRVPVQAWIDVDADGTRDADEPPLGGVTFVLENIDSAFQRRVASTMTRADGVAGLSAWLPGCPAATFEVYAEVPAGYRATTPGRVASEFGKPVVVGFVTDP